MKLRSLIAAAALYALCVGQASALEYTVDAPEDYLFGTPTSEGTVYEQESNNVDRGKNTALIPPGFGTATSYLPGSGEPLTPNLLPGAMSGGLISSVKTDSSEVSYQEVMLQYRCALKALESRLEILNEEFSLQHDRNPIESMKSRLKSPSSIMNKMQKRGLPLDFPTTQANIMDP